MEHALTDMGAEVGSHLIALSSWSQANFDRIRDARSTYGNRTWEPVT